MSFQDLWNKFPLIFGQLCDKKTCAFVVMRIGKNVENRINFSVCRLHFVPGLQSAICTDRIGISVFVGASLESRLKYWSWKKKNYWDYIDRYDRYVHCILKSPRGKVQWCSIAWSQRVLKRTRYGSPRCKHFGFSVQVAFSEVRKCDLGLLSLLNHINILILSTWVSELHRN